LRRVAAHVGCSGWQYKHWRGNFYPPTLPQRAWLEYYARRFDTVEINNTFYRLPEPSSFKDWRRRVPRNFMYAVKASRFLTHMKKLKDPEEPIRRFFERARHLGSALGPILYQLPPHWPVNVERLAMFLAALPTGRRHVIEFREPSWYTDDVFALLESYEVALCLHDMRDSESPRVVTGPFVYVRFHGSQDTGKYIGTYTNRVLDDWTQWLSARLRAGLPVYAYFNNDVGGHAPRDAVRLRERIGSRNLFAT
jgi:uncharacterized protein YecE (DUF72 family)